MSHFLSVDTIFFTVFGYPMSYIEFSGTCLYLWSVWLIARRNVLTWPIGIVSVLLYMALFYQIRLYSDTLEQIYYLGASIYGWWYWSKSDRDGRIITGVSFSDVGPLLKWLGLTGFFSVVLGRIMTHIHAWLPQWFPEPASYPYIDALTTVMSFTAMWLMARKRIESWIYWIIVDIIGVWLYYVKNVKFVALLYGILLVLAIKGLLNWMNANGKIQVMDEVLT